MTKNFPNYIELMKIDAYSSDKHFRDQAFKKAMDEAHRHQYANSPFYKRMFDQAFVNAHRLDKYFNVDFFIPTSLFKRQTSGALITGSAMDQAFELRSSATSGMPSVISVSRELRKRQSKTMAASMSKFLPRKKAQMIVFDLPPQSKKDGGYGARYGATVAYMNFAKSVEYVGQLSQEGEIILDEHKLSEVFKNAANQNTHVLFFGFTFLIYQMLKKFEATQLLHGLHSNLVHIGGWKKLQDVKISKTEFNNLIERTLNCRATDIIDVYGFTEQMGVNYPSVANTSKVTPVFSDVIVRDPESLTPLPNGQEGILQFISPLPTSYPGISVLTDDLGIVEHDFEKVGSRYGKVFRVTGRAIGAEIRGCGDALSNYKVSHLEKSNAQKLPNVSLNLQSQSEINLEMLELGSNFTNHSGRGNPNKFKSWPELKINLLNHKKKLELYKTDDLINFFHQVSKHWLEPSSDLYFLQQQGLSFLAGFLSGDNLRFILNESINSNYGSLDKFIESKTRKGIFIRAMPKGLVGHWLAGNVPLLGMLCWAQSVITKNANILKLPSADKETMSAILKNIASFEIKTSTGSKVRGSDLVDSTALIYYDRNDVKTAENFSMTCDARIAWGGAEAVLAVNSLPSQPHCETIIFGPKLSLMAIGEEAFGSDQNINKLFRRIAVDVSVFDQHACASPHNIFVEKQSYITPSEFCHRLDNALKKVNSSIPKASISESEKLHLQAKRSLNAKDNEVFGCKDLTHTIVLCKELALCEPVYSRFVFVHFLDDIMEVSKYIHSDIQTVAVRMNEQKLLKFAETCATRGAIRFPEIGRATHFQLPWDGVYAASRLVKYVSAGGPSA